MASTREERLQMRQRGAGTHKTKAIDFGFSFGGIATGPSDSTTTSLFPQPNQPPQTETATPTTTPPGSQTENRTRRTPSSARNNRPERPSPYDIPVDGDPAQQRSSKRRKINPSSPEGGSPARTQNSDPGNLQSIAAQNGDAEATLNPRTGNSAVDTHLPASHAEANSQPSGVNEQVRPEENLDINRVNSDMATTSQPAQKGITTPGQIRASKVLREKQPVTDDTQRSRHSPQRLRTSRSPHIEERSPNETEGQPTGRRSRKSSSPASLAAPAGANATRKETGITQAITIDTETSEQADGRQSPPGESLPVSKRGRSRKTKTNRIQTPKDVNDNAANPNSTEEMRDEPAQGISQVPSKKRPVRRKPSPGLPTASSPETHEEEEAPELDAEVPEPSDTVQSQKRARGKRPQREPSPAGQSMGSTEAEDVSKSPSEPSAPDTSTAVKRPRRGKKKGARSQPELEARHEPEPEADADARAEAEAGSSQSRRPQSYISKGKRAAKAQTSLSGEQADTEAPQEPQEPQRKTRQPRGETVPVTVYRLANASALDALSAPAEGPDDDAEVSPDELLSRLNSKVATRGGVNPADVLGQICRETLEKTLDKLKAGIDSETNAQKRAEWTRKRKAVEAFGSELDSRLLDLSEILDSNFMLATQLRKAKRDMMDLRSHLYKVRKERESIAIQMDAVRAKHMDEENAKTARNTINNSLHSLELALDRSQNRAEPSTGVSPADLEFMLRVVAEDVSCRAPGAQGGLLDQIRAFNRQLEATARRLERP